MKYGPHKSSLFDLDANIAALLIYLLPMLIGFITDSLNSIAWIIPLLAFIFEKESGFVIFHAANALSFYVIKAVLYFITLFMGFSTVLSTVLLGGITSILIFVIIIAVLIVNFIIFIITIVSMIKAYNYEEIIIPVLSNITHFIINLKR